jgi:hypothetical protein
MGHYCDECGEKLMGGIVAKTCECAECFCSKCWKNMFKGNYTLATKRYYYYIDEVLIEEDKELYFVEPVCGYCKHCKKSYGNVDNFNFY